MIKVYCRICGNQHGGEVNYCPQEGIMTIEVSDSIVLEQDASKYCRSCGNENEQQNLYCEKCGQSLYIAKNNEQTVKLSSMESRPKVDLALKKSGIKTGVIGGIMASVLMLIAGWLGSLVLAGMMEEVFSGVARELDMLSDFYNGTISTLLSYHLLGFSVGDADGLILSLSWHTPFLLLLIIPFVILGGIGIWMGKQRVANTIGEQMTMAMVTGIIYGFFLFVGSFIASKTITLPVADAVTVGVGYSAFKSLLTGFICGTIFSLLGMIAHTSQNNMAEAFRQLMPYGASLYYGVAAMVKGLLLTAVIVCVTVLLIKEESIEPLDDLTSTTSQRVMVALQFTPHIWGMTHLAPTELESPVLAEEFLTENQIADDNKLRLSFLTGMSFGGTEIRDIAVAEGATPEDLAAIDDINGKFNLGLFLLVIPFFFMFRAGQKLASMPSSNIYVTLAVCSGAYTFMMVMMNIFAKFQIDVSGSITSLFGVSGTILSIQNSFIYIILGSFILTYIAAFVGMKVAKK